jgi:N6-adenosine-specific RNA methylase IME4
MRRILAMQMLGKDEIDARVLSLNDLLDAEIDENNQREPFSPTEKVSIALAIENKIGKRQGKKHIDVKTQGLINTEAFPEVGMDTRDFVAKKAGLGSGKTYQHAKHAIEHAIPDVIEAMDRSAISIYCAYTISKEKKNKQLTLLNQSINDPNAAAEDLKDLANKRRAAKRSNRTKTPQSPNADPVYNLLRVAPDWYTELQGDIEALPVADYAMGGATVAVFCPAEFIAAAIQAVAAWGFYYRSIVTVYDPKHDEGDSGHLEFSASRSQHIVIATIDPDLSSARIKKLPPVHAHKNPQAELANVMASMWPDKQDKRIDLSATEAKAGWKIWKIDYASKGE